jgi:hypothetical protein
VAALRVVGRVQLDRVSLWLAAMSTCRPIACSMPVQLPPPPANSTITSLAPG